MQFDEVLRRFTAFFDEAGIRYVVIGGVAVTAWGRARVAGGESGTPRDGDIDYEGEDVRVLLNVPGVDRNAVREYFRRHGLLDLFDAIDKAR